MRNVLVFSYASQLHFMTLNDLALRELRGRGKEGRTRRTPIKPIGCRMATARQHIAKMYEANEGQ
jgi:hypothetical protein